MCVRNIPITLPNYSIGSTQICSGQSTTLVIAPTPPVGSTITWYKSTNCPGGPFIAQNSSLNGPSLVTNPLSQTSCYYATVNDGCCFSTTNIGTVTVCPPLVLPQSFQEVCNSWASAITFSSIPSQNSCYAPTVWSVSRKDVNATTSVITSIPLSGFNVSNSSIQPLSALAVTPGYCFTEYSFTATVQSTSGCGTYVGSRRIKINAPTVAGAITMSSIPPAVACSPDPDKICNGEAAILTYNPVGCERVLAWYELIGPNWNQIYGAGTSLSYWTNNLYASKSYRIKVQNGNCPFQYVSYTVNVKPPLTVSVAANKTCVPNPATLTSTLPPGYCSQGLTYQWYRNGLPIGGATSSTYSVSTEGNYRVKVTDATCLVSATSNGVAICEVGIELFGPACVCQGDAIYLSVATQSCGTSCQPISWYRDSPAPGNLIVATNNPTLILPAPTFPLSNVLTYCAVYTCGGCTATSYHTVRKCDPISTPIVISGVLSTANCGYNIACHGAQTGFINISTTGGIPPLTYSWSNGGSSQNLTGVGAGSYSVTVSDNHGNSSTSSFTLTAPPQLVQSLNLSNYNGFNVSCNAGSNGTASILVSGGCAPYSYTWSNGGNAASITGLVAGTYSVTVTDANGCTGTSVTTLQQPPALVVNAGNNRTICPGANTTLGGTPTISGGVGPYTYSWVPGTGLNNATQSNPIATPTGIVAYALTASDLNGCSASATVQVSAIDVIPPTALCQSATVLLGINGTGSVTAAQVNNGSTDNCGLGTISLNNGSFNCLNVGANTVTMTVTDVNGNSSSCVGQVMVQDNIPPTASCRNLTYSVGTIGGIPVQPSWLLNTPTDNCGIASILANGGTAPITFTIADVGINNVSITVTDLSGNSTTCTATVTILPLAAKNGQEAEGASDSNDQVKLKAAPNPFATTTRLMFSLPDDCEASLEIYDRLGRKISTVFHGKAVGGKEYEIEFDASGLSHGGYVARLSACGNLSRYVKLILLE